VTVRRYTSVQYNLLIEMNSFAARQQVNQLRAALESAASQPVIGNTIRQRSSLPIISVGTTDAREVYPSSPQRTPRKGDIERKPTSISINTDTRAFEGFIRSISKIQNVTEAKRLRHDVEREIRGVKGKLNVHTMPEVTGPKGKDKTPNTVKRLEAYLTRLEAAKRKVDRKVAKLLGVSSAEGHASEYGGLGLGLGAGIVQPPTLREILSNPSPLSFYMEFMDRRKQARLVQFWLTVESFKNPLEEVDSSDDDEVIGLDRMSGSMQRLEGEALETVKEDVSMIWSMFLDPSVTAEPVPLRGKLLDSIRSAINPDSSQVQMLPLILDQARKSTFRAQRDIYDTMLEDHFQDFVRTDLYRKAVIDLNKAASKKGANMVELGSNKLTAVTSRTSDNDVAAMRQGSLSPVVSSPPLPNQSGQSRWLNQLVGFGGGRNKGELEPSSPTTPLAAKSKRHFGSFPSKTGKLEVASPPAQEGSHRELPRARSWTIGRTMPNSGSTTPSATSRADQALGFLVGADEPESHDGRSALFATEDDSEFQSPERGRFLSEQDDDFVQVQRMEAIQAALTSIIDRDDHSRNAPSLSDGGRLRGSMDSKSHAIPSSSYEAPDWDDRWDPLGAVPSAIQSPDTGSSSRPLFVDAASRVSVEGRSRLAQPSVIAPRDRKVFDSSDEAPRTDSLFRSLTSRSVPSTSVETDLLSARSKGVALTALDTQLSIEIARLAETLVKLDEQDHILDQMIRTADLTGKESELNLLLRSQSDLRRELRATRFRKMQYEQQEIDYRLDPERTRLSIPNATILAEEAGKQIVRYVVEIQQYSMEGDFLQGWAVARRYNEFWDLQHALKGSSRVGPEIKAKGLDVPAKKLLPKLTDTFVEGRRLALESYMRVSDPAS
jgi:sorting nexin-25